MKVKKKTKGIITGNVTLEAHNIIASQGRSFNFSQWLDGTIKSVFYDERILLNKKKELLEELKIIDDLLKLSKKQEPIQPVVNAEERKFIRESLTIIKSNPGFLEGRRRHYNNEFRKTVSRQEFIELINSTKGGDDNV